MGYIYYYNNVRDHSSLNYQTPFLLPQDATARHQ
jgi:hypothetical protein